MAPAVLALVLSGCGIAAGGGTATPTIVPLPEETKAAVNTAEAARLLGGATLLPTATSMPAETATTSFTVLATATPPAPTTEATLPATAVAAEQPAISTPAALPTEHTVLRGENLTKIAAGYGVTVQGIVDANGIDSPSSIYTGQVLVIPAPTTPTPTPPPTTPTPITLPAEHTVLRGENLTKIARVYGVTVQDIVDANGIDSPSSIYPGQVLIIPAPMATGVSLEATPTPAPTPAGGRIAFQLASGGQIWAVSEDGSGLELLTDGLDPAWSPDGSKLAFVRWDEPRGLYVLDTSTGEQWLVRGDNLVKSPSWDPSGSLIAYSWESSGATPTSLCFPGFGCLDLPGQPTWALTVVDLEGVTVGDLPADERSFSPSWSRQGSLIVYQGERALKATALDGGQPTVILDDVAATFPEISPDGTQIVFMYRQHDHWEVYTVGTDGSGLRRLTESSPLEDTAANNVAPTWSPDGTQVLFLSDRDGSWRPYVMAADGSGQRPFLPEVFDGFVFQYEYAAERVFSWR